MLLFISGMIAGIILLVWSADRFVDGASAVAAHAGVKPLLIGMVVIGFGTSAPELVVSTLSSITGNPGIAIGNAYGSNIANIALILGFTAIISPVTVSSSVLHRELPILALVSLISVVLIQDLIISRLDATILLGVFGLFLVWSIWQGRKTADDHLSADVEGIAPEQLMSMRRAMTWLLIGLGILIASSRILVYSAVGIAETLGVSDLVIGLTIVAVGTSLPELASSIIAARKGAHDLAFGNILGSNMFNTLAVVGVSAVIRPYAIEQVIISRDVIAMLLLTFALFLMGYGFRGRTGRINRVEGVILLGTYIFYVFLLLKTV